MIKIRFSNYIILMILLLSTITLLLVDCSVVSSKKYNEEFNVLQWNKNKQKLSNLKKFQARGLIIYSYNKKKTYAHFFWEQVDESYYCLTLTNLLGSTILKLNAKPNFIQIINNEGCFFTDTDAERLINRITGISIPFNNLSRWILGLPGNAVKCKFNNQHLLSEIFFIQDKKIWKIMYNNYNNKIDLTLPLSIELTDGSHYFILKINKWIIK